MPEPSSHHDPSTKPFGNLIIRPETEGDARAIHHVVESAFGSKAVAEMVESIRTSSNYVPELSLVAQVSSKIVGYAMLSFADLVDGSKRHQVLNLSPLAIAPEVQGRGVGTSLVKAALTRAGHRGDALVVLEGNPDYYGRFGFEDSRQFGIYFANGGLIHRLSHYRPSIRGDIRYPPAFAEMERNRERERLGHAS